MAIRLNQEQLFTVCRILSKDLHNIYITEHAEQRMEQRKISYDDIINALSNPIELLDIRLTEKRYYAYKIHGSDKNKHIVFVIDEKTRTIHVVTVINKLYNH